jgi:hypothetical protein
MSELRSVTASSQFTINAALVVAALLLFAGVSLLTGRLTENDGFGWDGVLYGRMLSRGIDQGIPQTAVRPLVVMLNRPAFYLTGDALAAFAWMNYLYLAVLCVALCVIFARYNHRESDRALFLGNLFLTISVAKYVAFYPALVDAGALAIMAVAICLLLHERWGLGAVACVAAVLAREFGMAVVAFGVVRAWRRGMAFPRIALTFLPAVAAFFAWRWYVVTHLFAAAAREERVIGIFQILQGFSLWADPKFAAFFLYFVVTLFGGISLLTTTQPRALWNVSRSEPEWAVFGVLLVGTVAGGNADIWRYLLFLLPLVTVLFAVTLTGVTDPSRRAIFFVAVTVATLVTQRPWQAMDTDSYFRDWFPYYLVRNKVSPWPLWGWRLLIAAGLIVLFLGLRLVRPGARVSESSPVRQEP